ncbi:MAG: TonB-dependent receptor [Gammaproteobacteria bacterium]|nr:TonB-dependent receptor [Gammaproteobacteria bacterium]
MGLTPVSQAQEEEEDELLLLSLEELLTKVTIASGIEQSTARAPATASVITAEDIEAMGADDLDEVLESVPGLHVARSYISYAPIYTFRGMYTVANPQVLLLVNGIPMKLLFSGGRSMSWGSMPVNAIKRIEIIRGPGSAMYGADAFAGVINITTKEEMDINGTEAGARAGSFHTHSAWLLHGGRYGAFDTAFTVEYSDTDGHGEIIEADAQTRFDRIFHSDASLAPGPVNIAQRDKFDVFLNISRGDWRLRAGYQGRRKAEIGAGMVQALDETGSYSEDRFKANLTWHNPELTENWDVTALLSYYAMEFKTVTDVFFYPQGAFAGRYPNGFIGNLGLSETHSRLNLSAFYSGFDKHLIRTGAGYYYGDLYELTYSTNSGIDPTTGAPRPPGSSVTDVSDTPYAILPEKARDNWYAFLQDSWTLADDLELTAGLRYDEYSDFGSTLNPRLALVWELRPDLTGKALYGRAFRAPAFRELYTVNVPVIEGNPDLDPETIDTMELALDWRATDELHLTGNLFTYKWKDAIIVLPDANNAPIAQNAGTQEAYGLEFEARWKPGKNFSLVSNYAFHDATDKLNDDNAGNAPRHSVHLRANWRFMPDWRLNIQTDWIGGRKRVAGDSRPELDDYITADLNLRYKKNRKNSWTFVLGVRNLFDEEAREPSPGPDANGAIGIPRDLPLAGRRYFGEIRYHFR